MRIAAVLVGNSTGFSTSSSGCSIRVVVAVLVQVVAVPIRVIPVLVRVV